MNVLDDTKSKLGRPLQKREIDFLLWMYERYETEQEEKPNCCLKVQNIN